MMINPTESPETIARQMYRYDQPARHRVPSVDQVTEETFKTYYELGYVAIDNVFSEDEIAAAQQEITDVISGKIVGPRVQFFRNRGELTDGIDQLTPEEKERQVRKLHKFVEFCPGLHHLCYHPKVLSLLERILGEPARLCEDQGLLKPASKDAGIEKPWHQDMAYNNFAFTQMVVGVWVALDEALPENGCMHVIPGSHSNGPVPHYVVRDWQLCDAAIQVARDEVVALKPGGILVFTGLLHHGTPPNISDKRRRALQFHYAPQSAKKMTAQEYKLFFTNEMTKAEC